MAAALQAKTYTMTYLVDVVSTTQSEWLATPAVVSEMEPSNGRSPLEFNDMPRLAKLHGHCSPHVAQ
eukprot:5160512-Amphidinium_carterae.1